MLQNADRPPENDGNPIVKGLMCTIRYYLFTVPIFPRRCADLTGAGSVFIKLSRSLDWRELVLLTKDHEERWHTYLSIKCNGDIIMFPRIIRQIQAYKSAVNCRIALP